MNSLFLKFKEGQCRLGVPNGKEAENVVTHILHEGFRFDMDGGRVVTREGRDLKEAVYGNRVIFSALQ